MNEAICHLAGDYLVQSDWMASQKTKSHGPAAVHAVSYAACFLPLTRDPRRLVVIAGTHFVIDRWRLARHWVWAKNQLAPRAFRYPKDHADFTGYHAALVPGAAAWRHLEARCVAPQNPLWLSFWLLVLADNTLHLICNRLALR